jgi:VCBS repeat-containing protein
LSFSTTAHIPGFVLHHDGSYSFDPTHSSYDHLGANQHQTLTVAVKVTDSHGASDTQNLVITVNGTDDKAVVSGTHIGTAIEDLPKTAAGVLQIHDVDDHQTPHFQAQHIAGQYGDLNMDNHGHWSYVLDNAKAQIVPEHHTVVDTLHVTATDGTSQDITIKIEGKNDIAHVTGDSFEQIDTTQAHTTSGQLHVTDVDTGEAHFTAGTIAGQYGDLHIDEHGSWNYDMHNGVTPPAGHSLLDHIDVTTADGTSHSVYVALADSPQTMPSPPPPVSSNDAPDHESSPLDVYMTIAGDSTHHTTNGASEYLDLVDSITVDGNHPTSGTSEDSSNDYMHTLGVELTHDTPNEQSPNHALDLNHDLAAMDDSSHLQADDHHDTTHIDDIPPELDHSLDDLHTHDDNHHMI